MTKNKLKVYAYLAGIIDGEGSIDLKHLKPCKARRQKNESWVLRVQVKMNNGKPLDLLKGVFDGRLSLANDEYNAKLGYFRGFCWCLYGNRAAKMLKKLLPFLRVKKKQAELAIRWQTHMNLPRNDKAGLSKNELELRRRMVEEMHKLNQNQIVIPAGLETEQAERAKALMRQSKLARIYK